METQHLQSWFASMMTDPEMIALESIEDDTKHFIFGEPMLRSLRERGLVEPQGGRWRVTEDGQRALHARIS